MNCFGKIANLKGSKCERFDSFSLTVFYDLKYSI